MTGRHPNRMGTFAPGWSLRPEEITVAHLLSKAGYQCAHFGKWHVGTVKAGSPTNPGAMGFHEWLSHDNFFELNPSLSRNGGPPQVFEGESSEILVREANAMQGALHSFRLTLAASEDLGTILGRAHYHMGSGGTLRLDDATEHLDVPSWIDGGLGLLGRGQLWKRFQTPSSFAPEVRARFDAATLAAARRLRDGQPGLALSALASEQDQRLLPADLETRRPFIFYVNGVESGRRQSTAITWIHPVRAFGGEERTEMRLALPTAVHGDQRFEAEVRLRGAPLPEGAKGEIELPLTLDYRVSATRGKPFLRR